MNQDQTIINIDNDYDWETSEERVARIHHEYFERVFTLLVREPSLHHFFQSIDIKEMISLCCNYKCVADVLKSRVPQVAELYNQINFDEIYDRIEVMKLIRSAVNHFKPKKIELGTSLGTHLPADLLGAFTLNSPERLTIKLRGPGQHFTVYQIKLQEVFIESSVYERSANAINAILQSSSNLEKVELSNGCIDDITSTLFGLFGLESFKLNHVQIQCRELDLLAMNLTKQVFMEDMCLRYYGNINVRFLSFLLDGIGSMNLRTLELSFGKCPLNIYTIAKIRSLEFIRVNIEQHSSLILMQQLCNIINERKDIKFEMFIYCSCDEKNSNGIDRENFQQFENVKIVN